MNLDLLAIVATIAVAWVTGWYTRRGSLDTALNDRLKLLLEQKDAEIKALRTLNKALETENETLKRQLFEARYEGSN